MAAVGDNASRSCKGARTVSGAGYALRTCLSCRQSKTRCQLPDLTVTSSSKPLSKGKACRRCQSLSIACVVDDSQRRLTKAGTSRYGLDGLLQRSALADTSLSDVRRIHKPRRAFRGVPLPSAMQTGDGTTNSLRCDGDADMNRSRGQSPSSDERTAAPDDSTPSDHSFRIPDPLRPGMFDLLYSDVSAALAATAAASSVASSTLPSPGPTPPYSANRPSDNSSCPSPVAPLASPEFHDRASRLELWNPFLYWNKLLQAHDPAHTTNDFLAVTLQHLNLLLSPSPDHATSNRPPPTTLRNGVSHQQGAAPPLTSSRKKLMARVAWAFLGREQPSLRTIQSLILLSAYDPPDLLLPHTLEEGSDLDGGGGNAGPPGARQEQDTQGLSRQDAVLPALPTPGLALADLACSMAHQIDLPRLVASVADNSAYETGSQAAPSDVARFLTLIALFNLRASYLLSRTINQDQTATSLALLHGLSIPAVLDRFDRLIVGVEADVQQPSCQKVAIRAVASQFKMSSAFLHAFRSLRVFPLPISTAGTRVEELHARFRSVVQTTTNRFALETRKELNSVAADKWLVMLRTQATDMELALWSHCIYLELGPHTCPTTTAENQTVNLPSSIEYDAVFQKLKERDFQGARFLATVTERCTDLAHTVLSIANDLLAGDDDTHSTCNAAPLILRCAAVFKAVKILSQLWMLVLLKWASPSARTVQALDVLDMAARTLRDAKLHCMPDLALLVRIYHIRTNEIMQKLLQDKQDESACVDRKMLINFAGGLHHDDEVAEVTPSPKAPIISSTEDDSAVENVQPQSRFQIDSQNDSQSIALHPLEMHSSRRSAQLTRLACEAQDREPQLVSTLQQRTQSHLPDPDQYQQTMQQTHQQHHEIEQQPFGLHSEQGQASHARLISSGINHASSLQTAAASPVAILQPNMPLPCLGYEGILWDDLRLWDFLNTPR